LVTDFVNLNIKSAQSFRCVYRSKLYVRVFIKVSARTYMSIVLCRSTNTRMSTHFYEYTHAHPTPISNFERLSRLDLKIHEVGH
jgi:hypothetical protein